MQEYRAYVLGPDGHIQERIDLVCADDDAAKERAKALVDGHDVELWQLDASSPISKPGTKGGPVGLFGPDCDLGTIPSSIASIPAGCNAQRGHMPWKI